MNWPQFVAEMSGRGHADPKPQTHRYGKGLEYGPIFWRVTSNGKAVEMKDKPGVLADILAAF